MGLTASQKRSSLLVTRARAMLASPTASEQLLWDKVLSRRQLGVVFRRQVPVAGRYIADFYASSCRVIVEVDGGCHRERRSADARRDRGLSRHGAWALAVCCGLILVFWYIVQRALNDRSLRIRVRSSSAQGSQLKASEVD